MLLYGMAKLVPIQMPDPPLATLLRPYGDFSPLSMLWLQIGSSPVYEMVLGAVEVCAGLLLFLPRTATLGALLSLVGIGQVFLLNMTYDVPVKVLSFHLVVMSMVLLAPQARRLADVLVLDRPCAPATQPAPFATPKANRIAAVVSVTLGVWVLAGLVPGWIAWYQSGGARPKTDLYGIWSVSEFTRAGIPVPALATDRNRWQRIVFDDPSVVDPLGSVVQRVDGTLIAVAAAVNDNAYTVTLSVPGTPNPLADFRFDRSSPDDLQLQGRIDGAPVTITLHRENLDWFTLRNRGFHWIQEDAYFR